MQLGYIMPHLSFASTTTFLSFIEAGARLQGCKVGLSALVVRLVGLLLVFASQKIVHDVQNEMA